MRKTFKEGDIVQAPKPTRYCKLWEDAGVRGVIEILSYPLVRIRFTYRGRVYREAYHINDIKKG
jgi:hypothetical protein